MIIDNETNVLKSVLKDWISKSDEIMICSPFITTTDVLFELMEGTLKFTLICRLSFPATPALFTKLLNYAKANKSIYVYDDNSLHSKIYLFRKNKKSIAAIIGSSNFTNSGISSNKEYNVLLTKGFEEIERYFKHIIKDSFCKLEKSTIEYYKSFYKPIELEERYRRARISPRLSEYYSIILEKFNFVKGILEKENTTDLPFTYIFDTFAHYFKVAIIKDYQISDFSEFNKNELKKYFKIFLKDYLTEDELSNRGERCMLSERIKNNINSASNYEIEKFFLGIHSISNGSGSGIRIKNIQDIDKSKLKALLDFIINVNLSMPHKYSIALTNKEKNGMKIRYIADSAVGEIPGWILPNEFPIINGKLDYVFKFFKV